MHSQTEGEWTPDDLLQSEQRHWAADALPNLNQAFCPCGMSWYFGLRTAPRAQDTNMPKGDTLVFTDTILHH